jgi:hypothetical protein
MQLGKAIGILLKAHGFEADMHEDVDQFNAPSECHELVSRGESQRLRFARRRACHVAGFKNMRLMRNHVRRVMGDDRFFYYRYDRVLY